MNHLQANNLLIDFVTGALPRHREEQVRCHLEECSECREWVATYSFLETTLSDGPDCRAERHLASDALAAFVVSPETLDDATRKRCQHHLNRCPACSHEMGLVQAAVAGREVDEVLKPDVEVAVLRTRKRVGVVRLAWAACLLGVLGILLGSHVTNRVPDEFVVSGMGFEGEQTVKAKQAIIVDSTEVHTGASLGLQSGQTVAFGEGFTVESGASLYVMLDGNGS